MLATVVAAALVFVNAPDGDTLTVRDGNVKTIVRLAEIDAPERTQPYSQVSRRNLVACHQPSRPWLHWDSALNRPAGPSAQRLSLKMAYAGLNKGLTALAASMAIAATRAGAANALRDELAYSQPQLLAHIGRTLPDMYPKAHRWEFEMREVAAFAGEDSTAQIFKGIADLYLHLAKDWKGERQDVGAIGDFLAGP